MVVAHEPEAIGLYPPTQIVTPPALAAMAADVAEVKRMGESLMQKEIEDEGDVRAKQAPRGQGDEAEKAHIARATAMFTTDVDAYKRDHGGVQPCKPIDIRSAKP